MRLVTVLVLLGSLTACDSFMKGFREGYCREYPKSYLKACTDTCLKKGANQATCDEGCAAALAKEADYQAKCRDVAPQ